MLVERKCHVQAHEDKQVNFIPDLSFAVGGHDFWLEVKYCKEMPKTLGSIAHYTRGQQEWLTNRNEAGGSRCYLLVGLPPCELLLPASSLDRLRTRSIEDAMTAGARFTSLLGVARHLVW